MPDRSDARETVAAARAEHQLLGLRRAQLASDPVEQLRRWWDEAAAAGVHQPDALALATADATGRPSVRFVLVRGLDRRGLVFFTNHGSQKARELGANPHAAGVLAWHDVSRQARVAGPVERVSEAESDAYWVTRPRASQLAARASPQGEVVAGRAELAQRLDAEVRRWLGRPVDRPDWWGGYRLVPDEIEVWQGRADRFHDRFRYRRTSVDRWRIERLAP